MTIKRLGHPLTERERECLALVSIHGDSDSVAREMCVSRRTVEFHLRGVYAKLGVHNRVAAINAARREGVIR